MPSALSSPCALPLPSVATESFRCFEFKLPKPLRHRCELLPGAELPPGRLTVQDLSDALKSREVVPMKRGADGTSVAVSTRKRRRREAAQAQRQAQAHATSVLPPPGGEAPLAGEPLFGCSLL